MGVLDMSKYEPLKNYLAEHGSQEVQLGFRDIESIIGFPLPPSARKHRAWWSNNPSNSVITYAWLAAGYETARVDMVAQKLVFRRVGKAAAPPAEHQQAGSGVMEAPFELRPPVHGVLNRLRSALRGTVRFAPGYKPTDPTGEVWDAEVS
jgi:hypothetical protein